MITDAHILCKKLAQLEREISSELGPFALFSLALPDDDSGYWALFVAASWFREQEPPTLTPAERKTWGLRSPNRTLFYDRFVKSLTMPELIALRGALQFEIDDPFVRAFVERAEEDAGGPLEHGMLSFTNWTMGRADFLRGYVMTANNAQLPAPAPPPPRPARKKKVALPA